MHRRGLSLERRAESRRTHRGKTELRKVNCGRPVVRAAVQRARRTARRAAVRVPCIDDDRNRGTLLPRSLPLPPSLPIFYVTHLYGRLGLPINPYYIRRFESETRLSNSSSLSCLSGQSVINRHRDRYLAGNLC